MSSPTQVDLLLNELFSLRQFGMKPGLETMRALAEEMDHPERALKFIHIAGTNGKGSTAAIIESVLRAAGLRTGLYTSPHLVWFGERIRVDNTPLDAAAVVKAYEHIRPALDAVEKRIGQKPTFFETTTAMALHVFSQARCDYVVWETGMGGRLDATNIVTPEISVITRIDFDHMRWLGDTLAKIASEKAGIIKPGVPVVTILQPPEAAEVFARVAKERGSPLTIAGPAEATADRFTRLTVKLNGKDVPTKFAGVFQTENIGLALKAIEIFCANNQKTSPHITARALRRGLEEARWPARMDILREQPLFLVDGAHNANGAARLAESLDTLRSNGLLGDAVLLTAALADKDVDALLRPLLPFFSEMICAPIASSRAMPPHELAARVEMLRHKVVTPGVRLKVFQTLDAAQSARELFGGNRPVVIAGSLYLAGTVMCGLKNDLCVRFSVIG